MKRKNDLKLCTYSFAICTATAPVAELAPYTNIVFPFACGVLVTTGQSSSCIERYIACPIVARLTPSVAASSKLTLLGL